MLRRILMTILGAGGLGLLTLPTVAVRAEPPLDETSGIEVQTRGPVHEAFAQPTDDRPQAGPVVPREPPAALDELPPDQKPDGANVRWMPGYWQWDDERRDYLWVSGFWRDVPPGRQWVPGGYRQTEAGWQWVPGFWAEASQGEMTYVPPPPEPPDVGPSTPAPDDTSTYVPGCWVYVETRYHWRPGFWLAHRRGWVYQPAHYVWTPSGCLFVDGYWDYPLEDRGLCFAPVYVPREVCDRPGFVYRPYYCVSADFLPGALFVRSGGYRHYYFGDYYGGRYARSYTPFVDARIGRSAPDPLFAYYRASRGAGWEREVRGLYAGRSSGDVAPPPRTLRQQETLIRGIETNRTNVTNVRNVTVVQPLPRAATTQRTLTTVSSAERTQARQEAVQVRQFAQQRTEHERRLASGGAPVRSNDPPRTVKVELPKQTEVKSVRPAPTPPPRPTVNVQPQVRTTDPRPEARHQDPPPVKHQDPPKTTIQPPQQVPKKVEPPPVVPKHQDPPQQPKVTMPPPQAPKVTTPVAPQHQDPPPQPKVTAPPQPRHQDPPPQQPKVTMPPPQPKVAAPVVPRHQDPPPQPKVTMPAPQAPKVAVAPPPRQSAPPPQPKVTMPAPQPRVVAQAPPQPRVMTPQQPKVTAPPPKVSAPPQRQSAPPPPAKRSAPPAPTRTPPKK